MSEPLLIDMSKVGRKAYCFPPLDLPRGFDQALPSLPASLSRQTAARLPEVAELDVVRHFYAALKLGARGGQRYVSTWILYHEIQPQDCRAYCRHE
jgi:hypothetical protein